MGQHFEGPAAANERGFYEERAVVAVNDRILAASGLGRRSLGQRAIGKVRRLLGLAPLPLAMARIPSRSQVLAAAAPFAQEMRALVAHVPSPGGWKDPKFVWTLEAWLQHIQRPVQLVICLRSPQDVSASVMRGYGMDEGLGPGVLQRWSAQYDRLLQVTADHQLKAICVEYDRLIAAPAEAIARLAEFVGRPLDATLVEPALRHHASEPAEEVRELYDRVRALSPK